MGRYSVRGVAAATAFVVLAGLVVVAPTAARAGDPPKGGGGASPAANSQPSITSPGPLVNIFTSPDLNCAVDYLGDTSSEFYGRTACGTFVVLGGTLYGPASVPAGGNASPRTAFTPVSQTTSGSGSTSDPWRIVTTVQLGESGVTIAQTDSYVDGQQSFRTDVRVRSALSSNTPVTIYRAADCYLENSDVGTGLVSSAANGSAVACVSASGRLEQFLPLTTGSSYMEGAYSDVWRAVGSQLPFPNTCTCDVALDNGAGLSWNSNLPAGGSATFSHLIAFAPSREMADTDGDALPDEWESNGLDLNGDGHVDLDLPAMGATPDHKDVFVEVDWMVHRACIFSLCVTLRSFAPNQQALTDVRNAFALSPVQNPDGTTGIRMHIDSGPNSLMNPTTGAQWGSASRSNATEYHKVLGTTSCDGDYSWAQFDSLKSQNWDPVRADVFHYVLYGDLYPGKDNACHDTFGSSGISRQIPGADVLLTDGGWNGNAGFTRTQERGTFMHELGHNLGLRHGGGDDVKYKPNYLSIMNYLYQTTGLDSGRLDYSRNDLSDLDEASLSEPTGLDPDSAVGAATAKWLCASDGKQRTSVPGRTNVDWNCNGHVDDSRVATDLSPVQSASPQTLTGHDDWPALVYGGGAIGAFGADDPTDQDPPPEFTPADEPTEADLTEHGISGQAGDGAAVLIGPRFVAHNSGQQEVKFQITNVGDVPATYTLRLTGSLAGFSPTSMSSNVAAHGSAVVSTSLDTSASSPGVFSVTSTLSSDLGGDDLAVNEDEIAVTDPAMTALLAPTIGLAIPRDSGAAVSWSPPESDGGSAILAYAITPYRGGVAQEQEFAGAAETTHEVAGLTNGSSYTFRVAAITEFGQGPNSAASNEVVPHGGTVEEGTNNVSFVQAVYHDFLHRAPTDTELASTVAALDAGQISRRAVVDQMSSSEEWVDATVEKMYTDTLGRAGEGSGVAFWSRQIRSHRRSVAQVGAFLYSSQEYFAGLGSDTPKWVTDLYAQLLHRQPDTAGLAHWSDRARTNRVAVAYSIFQSRESRGDRVDALYNALLGRASDSGGRDFWASRILTEGDLALAADLASSDEYLQRAITRYP